MSSVTEDIRSRIDLVELIGRTLQLRRVGSAYRGLCPFHTEKTPSFYVWPHTGTWHCFGCNRSGTAFDWVMEREHLEFAEALRALADMAGVSLPERREPEVEEQTQRLYTLLGRAQTYYEGLLHGTAGERARAYVARRGLDEQTQAAFGLGYAAGGNGLLRYLQNDGFSEQELQAAGVIGVADDGRPYDFFRDRLLFPIRDLQGRTIAFGGRSLDDAQQPKYLNSRDTLLFHKNETLFAIDLARRAMAQERQVVIVEGYMDAAMAHQHGYRNVVATLGTAVTERHLRLLRRHVDEIILALDADAAGQAATWRALQVADEGLRSGLTPLVAPKRRGVAAVPGRAARLRVLALPGAKDPDELIRSDSHAWPALVRGAVPVVDFILQRVGARHDLATAQGKAAAAEEISDVLVGIADHIEQAHYVQMAAEVLRLRSDEPVWRAVRRKQRWPQRPQQGDTTELHRTPEGQVSQAGPAQPAEVVEGDTLDEYALALLMRWWQMVGAGGDRDSERFEFALPASRALARCRGGRVPPELGDLARRVARRGEDVERLSEAQLRAELDVIQRELHRAALHRRKEQVVTLLRDVHDDDSERLQLEHALEDVLADIRALEQLEPALEPQKVGIA